MQKNQRSQNCLRNKFIPNWCRFYNTLIIKELNNSYACEKYLQYYCFLFAHKTSCFDKFMLRCNDTCTVTAKSLQGSIKGDFGQPFLSAATVNRQYSWGDFTEQLIQSHANDEHYERTEQIDGEGFEGIVRYYYATLEQEKYAALHNGMVSKYEENGIG